MGAVDPPQPEPVARRVYTKPVPMDVRTRERNAAFTMTFMRVSTSQAVCRTPPANNPEIIQLNNKKVHIRVEKDVFRRDTIIIEKTMKSSSLITISILVILAATLIAATFGRPPAFADGPGTRALRGQVTATPLAGDRSVIGSTNGIVVLGVLIVLIVTVPLIFRRRKK
jgi:hypothetical protein